MKGTKFDGEKARWDLVPFAQLEQIVDVITYGSKKYDDDNWKKVQAHRYSAALFRHLNAFMKGESHDEESGHLHLAHAGACLLFLMWHDHTDRIKFVVEQVWKDKKAKWIPTGDYLGENLADIIETQMKENSKLIRQAIERNKGNLIHMEDELQAACCPFCNSLVCSDGCTGYHRQQYLQEREQEIKVVSDPDRPKIEEVVARWEETLACTSEKIGAPCRVPLGFLRNISRYIRKLEGKR